MLSSFRNHQSPARRYQTYGFRVVLDRSASATASTPPPDIPAAATLVPPASMVSAGASPTATSKEIIYKSTPQGDLKLHFNMPSRSASANSRSPCIVFFFGGGWKNGTHEQFMPQAEQLAKLGMIAACADYRVKDFHGTTPDKAVEDAKSAIRWLRGHASELGVDPGKIVAAGGSAGGHLAACTALVAAFDAPGDDGRISAKPNALVLFNPDLDVSKLFKEGKMKDMRITQEIADAMTPTRFLTQDAPPAILFFGSKDLWKSGGDEYVRKARALGLRAEMWVAPNMGHGFFGREPWTGVTTAKMADFLVSIGYLQGNPLNEQSTGKPSLKPE